MNNNIDPLLYNPKTINLQKNLTILKNKRLNIKNASNNKSIKSSKTFAEVLRENLSTEKSMQISSDKFSRLNSKEKVLSHIGTNKNRQKMYAAAEQFESYFMEQMFKVMKKNVPKNKMFHGGFAEDIFDEMLLTERTSAMSHNSELGLAEMIYQQMNRM